jgi:hypothetical protein
MWVTPRLIALRMMPSLAAAFVDQVANKITRIDYGIGQSALHSSSYEPAINEASRRLKEAR